MSKERAKPIRFSRKVFAELCDRIAKSGANQSLVRICAAEDMPDVTTIFDWLDKSDRAIEETDPYFGLSLQYARAMDARITTMEQECVDIADDSSNDEEEVERADGSTYSRANREFIQRSNLRVDVRKWIISKHRPRKHGTARPGMGNDNAASVTVNQNDGAVQPGATGFVINLINSPDDSK